MPEPRYPRLHELPESTTRKLARLSLLAAISLTPRCGAMPYVSDPYDYYPTNDTRAPEESRSQDLYTRPGDTESDDLVFRPDARSSDQTDATRADSSPVDTPQGDTKLSGDAADALTDDSADTDIVEAGSQDK